MVLTACCAVAPIRLAGVLAAPDEVPGVSVRGKSSTEPKNTIVPIPSTSRDVSDNGCHVRKDARETFVGPDVDIQHVAFSDLISHAVGRYSVRATIDGPEKFMASLATLDADTRTLVLLDVLRMGLDRDGLHTFFSTGAGRHAPAIREALAAAGLKREHELFTRAMAIFGPDFPVDDSARVKLFSYSSLDTPLNAFDARMMEVARAFGARTPFEKAMVTYVERTPALWQMIEARRAQLSAVARLRSLNQALMRRVYIEKSDDVAARLAALPVAQRTLIAASIFDAEFGKGGVHQFFVNASGAIAPEVHAALIELGLDRQAALFKRGLAMFGAKYLRNTERRRGKYFDHSDWTDWDKGLQALTDDFNALDEGPTVVRLSDGAAVEGSPGLWSAMVAYARAKRMLPC